MDPDGILGEIHVPRPGSADASALINLDITFPVGLKVAVVERAQVKDLIDEWADAGVYLLLERPRRDGAWDAYVGKSAAAGGVRGRLRLHLQDPNKSSWYRAVAVCPLDGGWDEAEVAWLEGRVYRALQELPGVSLANSQKPGSGRLAPRRQMPLQAVSAALTAVLVLIGHPVSTGDVQDVFQPESPDPPVNQKRLRPSSKLTDLLEAGLLTSGAKLVALDARWPGEATVTAEGRIDVAGETYSSPSGAAKALTGRKAESGWDFWAVESADGPTLNELRGRHESGSTSPPTPETELGNTPASGSSRPGKLADLLVTGLLTSGAKLVPRDTRWLGEAIATTEGWIEVAGELYSSPSGAAKALTGRIAESGWDFWAIDSASGPTLNELRSSLASGAVSPPPSQAPHVNAPSAGLSQSGKLAGLLEAGLLSPGAKLVTRNPRWPGQGTVTAEGRIDVAGAIFFSPSGAAKALSGRKAEAGWDFWAVESADGPTLSELRSHLKS